jgi:hypothetical protein
MAAHDRKPMGDCGLIIFTGLMIATVTEGPLHWTKRVSIRVGPRSADLLHVVDATTDNAPSPRNWPTRSRLQRDLHPRAILGNVWHQHAIERRRQGSGIVHRYPSTSHCIHDIARPFGAYLSGNSTGKKLPNQCAFHRPGWSSPHGNSTHLALLELFQFPSSIPTGQMYPRKPNRGQEGGNSRFTQNGRDMPGHSMRIALKRSAPG